MRVVILSAALVLAVGVAPAAADPINSPGASPIHTVTCAGAPSPFFVVGTGAAGHVLGSTSIAVLLSADVSRYVDGELDGQFSFSHPPQANKQALTCSIFTEFVNAQGQAIRFEYENARIVLTPPKP